MKILHDFRGRGALAAIIFLCAGCGVSADGLTYGDLPDAVAPARSGGQSADSADAVGGSSAPAPAPGSPEGSAPAGGSASAGGLDAAPAAPDAGSPAPGMNGAMDAQVSPGKTASPDAAPPTPDAAAPAPPPSPEAVVIQAMEIEADVVRARVIYAKDVVADSGQIARRNENPDENRWQVSGSGEKIARAELVADTIYVKDLRCRRIEAEVVYAKRVVLGQN